MGQHPTKLTVIIPTYNRKDTLRICLEALNGQSVDLSCFEIIVVDDGSTDGTAELVAALTPTIRPKLHYLSQANAGANAARNRAIPLAAGSLLLIINDDTVATPSLIEEHLLVHEQFPDFAVAVLGRMTISPDLPFSLFHALHHDASFTAYEGMDELDWKAFFTCNLSVKKAFLDAYGYFHESLRWHEDIELGARLSRHGLRVRYNPRALAFHHHYLDEQSYLKIAEKEGKALAQWYVGQPDLLPELKAIGLHSKTLHTASPRHRLADIVINKFSLPGFIRAARVIAPINPGLARMIFAKAFQNIKRRNLEAELSRLSEAPLS